MKAVVLAAGEGRRLKPLTNTRPKPMVPVANRPILEHVVESLAEADVDDIVLVVGYKRDRIQTHFGDGEDWDVEIEYAVQEKQLGTGHAVVQAEELVDGEFLVLNGDRIIEAGLIEELVASEEDAMAVTRTDEPSDYGVVALEDDRVVDVVEKPPAHEAVGTVVNAGVYRLSPDVFDTIRQTEANDSGETDLTAALRRSLDGDGLRAVWTDGGLRDDVSYLWDLLDVNADVIGRQGGNDGRVHDSAVVSDSVTLGEDASVGANATVLAGTSVGVNASIAANAVVSNAVVFPDATIAEGCVVRDAIVGENVHLGPATVIEGGYGDVVLDGRMYADVRLGAAIGDNASVHGGVVAEPGTILGNDTTVATGSLLSGRIPTGADVRRG